MADWKPTYTYEGDQIFAIHEGKVIASGTDLGDVESDATTYLEAKKQEFKVTEQEKAKKKATHVITPNGIEGEILGRTPSLWGEEVSVRLANGNIHRFSTHAEDGSQWIAKNEKTAASKGITASLKERIETDFDRNVEGLTKRASELEEICDEAERHLAAGAPYLEEIKLDQIVTTARFEQEEVKDALAHLAAVDAEAFTAPAPFDMQAAPQVSLGRAAADNWLDVTVDQMVAESEGRDFDKLLAEGPSLFVAELDTPTLADAGTTRELALSHVGEHTAGFVGEDVENYRTEFIARVEVARRHELASHKETAHKEAAVIEESALNVPDDALFM